MNRNTLRLSQEFILADRRDVTSRESGASPVD